MLLLTVIPRKIRMLYGLLQGDSYEKMSREEGGTRNMKGNSYLYRKIHSLVGLIPLGGFFFVHLLTNYSAFKGGPGEFSEKVSAIDKLPLVLGLEIVLIWLPLLYHGVYGLYVA